MKQEQLNNGWFSVEKKLPPLHELKYRYGGNMYSVIVLIFDETSAGVYVGYFDFKENTWILITDDIDNKPNEETKITHWRFIPKLPNTED